MSKEENLIKFLIINRLTIFFLLSFLLPNDNLNIDYLSDDLLSNSIYLDLESHNKTGYLFDKYNPDIMGDFEYMNFKIDGSMMYPILNSFPKQIFFNKTDTTSMSQLSIIQDHSSRYYDTSVSLKTYLRKELHSLTQVESKSIYGNNYNQKFITSFYKNIDNLEFDVGYMYNQDDVITYIESSNDDFNRGIESFSSKFYIKYKGASNMIISNQFNSQISNYIKFGLSNPSDGQIDLMGKPIEYLSETNWNVFLINYTFGISSLELQSNYKYTVSDVSSHEFNQFFLGNNYHHLSISSKTSFNRHSFSIGIDNYNNKNYYFLNYKFNYKRLLLGAYIDNNVFLKVHDSSLLFPNMRKITSTDYKIELNYQNNNFMQSILIGKKNTEALNSDLPMSDNYIYYLYEASIKYDWLKLHLNYGKYNSEELYVQNYMSLSFIVSPKLENKRFRPYCKARISSIGINSNYSISNEELDLISDENSSITGMTVVDGEFGFLFNQFKVAFIKENMLQDYMYYSDDDNNGNKFTPLANSSKYLINIIWIFKD